MQPHVLLGDSSYCDAVVVRDGHIAFEEVCTRRSGSEGEVAWDGQAATITEADRKASGEWIRTHSVRSHLSIRKGDLYWDGKKVDLGRTEVTRIDEAIPWQGGVLISGATVPRKGFFESWPFKGRFLDAREIEPYCAIFFDPKTLRGEDLWLNGKVVRPFVVFPVPE